MDGIRRRRSRLLAGCQLNGWASVRS